MNDTYVNLDKTFFSIDQDVFNAKATIKKRCNKYFWLMQL
jgi:hypothetical protein